MAENPNSIPFQQADGSGKYKSKQLPDDSSDWNSQQLIGDNKVVVTGAGTATSNGIYTATGFVNGKRTYLDSNTLNTISWDGGEWNLHDDSEGSDTYVAGENTDFPWQASWSTNTGSDPAPQVAEETVPISQFGEIFLESSLDLSDVSNAIEAFDNIKQSGTTGYQGVLSLATSAETITGTNATKAVTPSGFLAGMLAGMPFSYKATDQSVANSSTLITGMSISLGVGTWFIWCRTFLITSTTSGTGYACAYNTSGGSITSSNLALYRVNFGATNLTNASLSFDGFSTSTLPSQFGSTGNSYAGDLTGIVVVGSATTLRNQFCQNVAVSGQSCTMKAGSFLLGLRVA